MPQGKSSVRVHGIFTIHGSEHELTVPAEVQMAPGYWTATLHFAIPYAAWGMKNPSTLFLKVSESVDIDLSAAGTTTRLWKTLPATTPAGTLTKIHPAERCPYPRCIRSIVPPPNS